MLYKIIESIVQVIVVGVLSFFIIVFVSRIVRAIKKKLKNRIRRSKTQNIFGKEIIKWNVSRIVLTISWVIFFIVFIAPNNPHLYFPLINFTLIICVIIKLTE